jgi:hypothetical protein
MASMRLSGKQELNSNLVLFRDFGVVLINLETQRRIIKAYLAQWAAPVPKVEQEQLLSLMVQQDVDYCVKGSRDAVKRFMTVFLMRERIRWVYRTTFDTIMYYLVKEEDCPDFADIVTPVLVLEHCKNTAENKLLGQLNKHLITQRQLHKKRTIVIPTSPIPELEPFCKVINLGEKSSKGVDIL